MLHKQLVILILFPIALFSQNFNYLPKSPNKQIVEHTAYTLSYLEKYEQAEWVAYKLSCNMTKGGVERKNKFISDPLVKTGSALPSDYTKSGFDKGHLCACGDMTYSPKTMRESFYMSNMSPQAKSFNRGVWKKLEELVREWSCQDSLLYIVTGPVLKNNLKIIGKRNKVAVPELFYKIVLVHHGKINKAIAFLIPNQSCKESLTTFVVSIDKVEAVTGIDFFPDLPDKLENELEKKSDIRKWRFN